MLPDDLNCYYRVTYWSRLGPLPIPVNQTPRMLVKRPDLDAVKTT